MEILRMIFLMVGIVSNFNTEITPQVGTQGQFNANFPPSVKITRILSIYGSGTVGVLTINSQFVCMTLEPPKFANKRRRSCIPTGQYECTSHYAKRLRTSTYMVKNVPNRKFILFHPGNVAKDSAGCILLGEKLDNYNGQQTLVASRKAFSKFLDIMDGQDRFILTIKESL